MSNDSSIQKLELENERLRRELAEARDKHSQDRDAIRSLIANGQLLDEEVLRSRIAAGGPYLPQLLEIEREMAQFERGFREILLNPIPLRPALEDADRLLGEDHGH